MKKSKAPFKLNMAALFLDQKPRDAAAVFAELEPDYARARFFSREFVAYQLQSLKAVCILQVDDDGVYSLTRHGAEKVGKSL